jgi:hypothetical protein
VQQGDDLRGLRQQGRTVRCRVQRVGGAVPDLGRVRCRGPSGVCGPVFDYFEAHPDRLRLSTWYRLERPDGQPLEAIVAVNQQRLEDLQRGQRRRAVPRQYTPVSLLSLIQAIATSWSSINPEYGTAVPNEIIRRRAVVMAVQNILS